MFKKVMLLTVALVMVEALSCLGAAISMSLYATMDNANCSAAGAGDTRTAGFTMYDSSGNGVNSNTDSGGSVVNLYSLSGQSGKFGEALGFVSSIDFGGNINNYDQLDIGSNGPGAGLYTVSYWFNWAGLATWLKSGSPLFGGFANSGNDNGWRAQMASTYLAIPVRNSAGFGNSEIDYGAVSTNTWHNLVVQFASSSGNGVPDRVVAYLDGNGSGLSGTANGWSLGGANGPNLSPGYNNGSALTLGNVSGDGSQQFNGKGDDLAEWQAQLTDGEARSLYTLGSTGALNYTAVQSQSLWNVFNGTLTNTTVNGLNWVSTTGLSGNAGDVVALGGGSYGLVLDGSGDGVIGSVVPEPGTLVLLVSGLIGLVCYAWRKRK